MTQHPWYRRAWQAGWDAWLPGAVLPLDNMPAIERSAFARGWKARARAER